MVTGPLPHILEQAPIPMPLHGLNPRTLMGVSAWDKERRRIYALHDYRCAACGADKSERLFKRSLEAHENYRIDWSRRVMSLVDIQPLCHACHAFVHVGLMEVRMASGSLSRDHAKIIVSRAARILEATSGSMSHPAARLAGRLGVNHACAVARAAPEAPWDGWTLEWEGRTYKSLYPTYSAYKRAMAKRRCA